MYGHAAHTLTACSQCPAWEPRWASALLDDGTAVCTAHYLALIGAAS